MRTFWIAVLALTVAPPVPAQLREVRTARSAFAFGWSDVTGYGTAVAFIERLRRVPLALGIAAGGGGAGAHLQVHPPNPFTPSPPEGIGQMHLQEIGRAHDRTPVTVKTRNPSSA